MAHRNQREEEARRAFDAAASGVSARCRADLLLIGMGRPMPEAALQAPWAKLTGEHPAYAMQINALSEAVIGGTRAKAQIDPLTPIAIEVELRVRNLVDPEALALLQLVVLSRHHERRTDYVTDARHIVDGLRHGGEHAHRVNPDQVTLPMVVRAVLRSELNPAHVRPVRRRRYH